MKQKEFSQEKIMFPNVSIIIPVKPKGEIEKVIQSLKKVAYPKDKIEVLIVRGNQPSRQRNKAVKLAKNEILYFLDNDSMVDKNAINQAVSYINRKDVAAVGGPALTLPSDSLLQKSFGYVLGSSFGTSETRHRFRSVGKVIKAKGDKLILCNLCFKKSIFLKAGGLNEALYPNEENELLKRLNARGYYFIYNPKMIIYRSQRATLFAFARQIFRYGSGRMDHFFYLLSVSDLVFLIPLFFCFYLISLIFWSNFYYLVPTFIYLFLNLLFSFEAAFQNKNWVSLPLLLFLFPLEHISYGLGTFWGMIKKILPSKVRKSKVIIERKRLV